jgi:hypothetical protein
LSWLGEAAPAPDYIRNAAISAWVNLAGGQVPAPGNFGGTRRTLPHKQAKKVKDAATSLAAEVVAGATSLNDAYRQVRSKPVQNHL